MNQVNGPPILLVMLLCVAVVPANFFEILPDNPEEFTPPENCFSWTRANCRDWALRNHSDYNRSCGSTGVAGTEFSCHQKCFGDNSPFCTSYCEEYHRDCVQSTTRQPSKPPSTPDPNVTSPIQPKSLAPCTQTNNSSRESGDGDNNTQVVADVTLPYYCTILVPVLATLCAVQFIALGFGFSIDTVSDRCKKCGRAATACFARCLKRKMEHKIPQSGSGNIDEENDIGLEDMGCDGDQLDVTGEVRLVPDLPDLLHAIVSAKTFEEYSRKLSQFFEFVGRKIKLSSSQWKLIGQKWKIKMAGEATDYPESCSSHPPRLGRQLSLEHRPTTAHESVREREQENTGDEIVDETIEVEEVVNIEVESASEHQTLLTTLPVPDGQIKAVLSEPNLILYDFLRRIWISDHLQAGPDTEAWPVTYSYAGPTHGTRQ